MNPSVNQVRTSSSSSVFSLLAYVFFTLGFIITIIFFGGKSTLITLTENTILATPERVAPPKPTPPPLAPQKVIEDLARTDAELATIEQALSAP